ncbi:MAG TPA: hypothetical protein VN961_09655 [Streptosporangiaceae bacterium]|nr:hypothetical protein [Streptosporangiaceae bacterium]
MPTGTKPTLFSPICRLPSGMNVGADWFAPGRFIVDDSLIGDQQSQSRRSRGNVVDRQDMFSVTC